MSSKRKTKSLSALTPRSFRRRVAKDIIEVNLVSLNSSVVVVTNNDVPYDDVAVSDLNVDNKILESESAKLNSSTLTLNSSSLNEHSDDSTQFELNNSDDNSSHDFYSSSSDEESFIKDSPPQIKDEIAYWALEYKVKHNALDALLIILKKYVDQTLPKCARTLLKTPRNTKVRIVNPGSYCHFGIASGLIEVLPLEINQLEELKNKTIRLKVSTDGLPLSGSSNSQLWPIMGCIADSSRVFIIGVYHGHSKPNDSNDFLHDFVVEITELIDNGFTFNDTLYKVILHCIICDAPAKSFITKTKGHTGYNSCTKCCQNGEYLIGRICFPKVKNYTLRTDDRFINQEYLDYHNGIPLINKIPNFKPISHIPLEYMHLVCIGVMKKVMGLWLSGKLASNVVHLSSNKITMLTKNLLGIKSFITKDFARRPQGVEFLKRWKATELRQLLLYTAPVVLYDVLHPQVYSHILTLHVALRIISSKHLLDVYADYAHELLEHFVDTFKVLYGKQYISHNIHGLLHMVNDVKLLGPVDSYSAFQFENCLRILKMQLRKSERPIQQIHRRYSEKSIVKPSTLKEQELFSENHVDGPISNTSDINRQFKKAKINNCIISIKSPDNVCIINNTIVEVHNYVFDNYLKTMVILGKPYLNKMNLYEVPCQSSLLNCYIVTHLAQNISVWPVSDVQYKCMTLPWNYNGNNGFAVFPILHSDCTQ